MLLPVADYLQDRDGERPVGVYGLLDSRHNLQYVGFSRNMVLSVKVRTSGCAGAHTEAHPSWQQPSSPLWALSGLTVACALQHEERRASVGMPSGARVLALTSGRLLA